MRRTPLLLAALSPLFAVAQSLPWTWLNPEPLGQIVRGMDMIDQQTGWASLNAGYLLRTTDGGLSWQEQQVGDFVYGGRIQFIGADTGWMALGGGNLLRTIDGGQNWSTVVTGLMNFPTQSPGFHFIDHLRGWVVGSSGQVRATTDGGNTWVPQVSNATVNLSDVQFRDALVGCITGSGGTLLRTADGGQTWSMMESGTGSLLKGLQWADSQQLWVATTLGNVLHSTDAGLTWSTVDIPGNYIFERFVFRTPQEGYLLTGVREQGMLRTTDGGTTWTPVGTAGLTIAFMEFTGAQQVVAAGGCSELGISTDGAATWTAVSSGTVAHLSDMQFVTPDTAYACGAGTLLRTIDGGATWSSLNVPDLIYDALHFITPLEGWLGGRTGTIEPAQLLHTADGGVTWDTLPLPPGNYVYDVWFTDPLHGWVCSTSNGLICRTTDGGATWTCMDPSVGNYSLLTVRFMDDLHGWLTGTGDQIYWTDDGGVTWNPAFSAFGTHFYRAQAFRDELVGLVCGDSTILRTADGGITWDSVNNISPWNAGSLMSMAWTGPDAVWAAGGLGVPVLRSTDAGLTWEQVDPGFVSILRLAWNGESLFASGGCGAIVRLDLVNQVGATPASRPRPLYPVPNDGRAFHLPLAATPGATATVLILDTSGRLHAEQRVAAVGDGYPVVLHRPLAPGAYAVVLHTPDGQAIRWSMVVGW